MSKQKYSSDITIQKGEKGYIVSTPLISIVVELKDTDMFISGLGADLYLLIDLLSSIYIKNGREVLLKVKEGIANGKM